jgi:uncharacterized membrane protein
MPIIFLLLILVMAIIGLVGSYYIYRHLHHDKQVECAVGSDCDTIVRSRYNNFYGWSNDLLGLGYFSITLVLSILAIIGGGVLWLHILILLLALVAGLYSLYLMYIQLRVLKHSCTWCFIPTISAVIILLATFGLFAI